MELYLIPIPVRSLPCNEMQEKKKNYCHLHKINQIWDKVQKGKK